MSNIKTNLSKMNTVQKVQRARQVITKMTGNATFTTPAPALTALTTAADAAEASNNAALAARASSKQATSTQKDKDLALTALLLQEAAYVQNITAGDKTKIESAGFEVRNPSAPIGPLPAPQDIELNANVNPGNMGLKWKKVRGAASYVVERALDGAAPLDYISVATPTNTKVVVNTMTSGLRYWFRVAAINTDGPGLWTLPVSKIAP
jgi:hypothetical protein